MFRLSSLLKPVRSMRLLRYGFSGLPAIFLRNSQQSSTEIVSLGDNELQQLTTLTQYETSVTRLQENKLEDSLLHLQFALAEAKERYPYSINLQACLTNREVILLKLLNRKGDFESKLEELYLISLSAKGPNSLDTIKHLINYLICLTVYSPRKGSAVLDFIKNGAELPEYLLFFDAINDIREQGRSKEGLAKLAQLPQTLHFQKVFKLNNLAFMRLHCLREENKNPSLYLGALKSSSQELLSLFLNALLEAENNPESALDYTPQELAGVEKLQSDIRAFLSKATNTLPTDKLGSKKILKNTNSHIIAMNIACVLFELERLNESFYFLQLSLEKAVNLAELERVGMAMILLGRCYYLQGVDKWEGVYLDLLEHAATYPKSIIKDALATYSRLLYQQGRLFQAEAYMNQSLSLEVRGGLEGLILPSYDFSF